MFLIRIVPGAVARGYCITFMDVVSCREGRNRIMTGMMSFSASDFYTHRTLREEPRQ